MYVSKLGNRCQGKDGKVRRNNPGGVAFAPMSDVVGVDVVVVVAGGAAGVPSSRDSGGVCCSSAELLLSGLALPPRVVRINRREEEDGSFDTKELVVPKQDACVEEASSNATAKRSVQVLTVLIQYTIVSIINPSRSDDEYSQVGREEQQSI